MKTKLTIKELVFVGMCAALLAVFSQISIPLPFGVPLTLQVFAIVIVAIVLEKKLATLSLIIYTMVGVMGVPVFANFNSGVKAIVGPTGGYIIGFIIMAFLIGWAAQLNNKVILWLVVYGGLAIDYAIGTTQLAIVANMSIDKAMAAGVYPFIIKDIIITGVGILVALHIKKVVGKQLLKRISYEA